MTLKEILIKPKVQWTLRVFFFHIIYFLACERVQFFSRPFVYVNNGNFVRVLMSAVF